MRHQHLYGMTASQIASAFALRPLAGWARPVAVRGYRTLKIHRKQMKLSRELNWWKHRLAAVLAAGRGRHVPTIDTLRLTSGQMWTVEIEANRCGVAAIASIDLDGNWHSRIGDIEGVPMPRDGAFRARTKFSVDIVWSPDRVGVRKQYFGNYSAFLRELSALHRLGRLGMRVPAILDVNFEEPTLILSYLPGRLLREELVKAGAPVRVSDCTSAEGWQRALAAGRSTIRHVVPSEFIAELAYDLRCFHLAGLMVRDIKWDNIIIGEDGHPWWLDFQSSEDHSELSAANFQVLADLDIERFNRLFGTELPTPTRGGRAGHAPKH